MFNGGERTGKYASTRIPDELEEYIKTLAERAERTRSWVIKKMLEYAVEKHKRGELKIAGV